MRVGAFQYVAKEGADDVGSDLWQCVVASDWHIA